MYLYVAGVEIDDCFNIHFVGALLHGRHKGREDNTKEDGGCTNECPALVSPYISPGQFDVILHNRKIVYFTDFMFC